MMRTTRRAGARWERSDSGITTLQVLVMFPIIVVLIGFSMQVALDYYAKQVALGAAQAGVNAVRYAQLGPNDEVKAEDVARTAAMAYVAQHGGNLLQGAVMVTPVLQAPAARLTSSEQITVEITGSPIHLLPIPSDPVDQLAQAPAENFTWGLK
jgi:hypothetical protein